MRAAWFGSREGSYVEAGVFPGNEKMDRFTPPQTAADPDYVLVLEAESRKD